MIRRALSWLFIALGWISLGLGVLGIFLPLLPTTPFVLLAAFLFSKGSERMHRWLREHPSFGRYIRDWEAEQVIPFVGKLAGTLVMVPSVIWAIATREIPALLALGMVSALVALLAYIWSRPSVRSATRGDPAVVDTGEDG